MYQGEVKILKVGNINRVAVGDAKLISTSLLNNGQLLLIAEGEGESTVHIWFNNGTEKNYTVTVNKVYGTLQKKADEVGQLLEEVSGLNIRVVGERVVLSGLIDAGYVPAIDTVKEAFPEIMDLTQKGALDRNMPENKMVFMNIKITEFNKNYLENLGIQWDTTLTGPAAALALDGVVNDRFRPEPQPVPSFNDVLNKDDGGMPVPFLAKQATSAFGYFGIATEITSRINLAVNSGNALILAEPRLATRSGGEANFLAGGEIPYSISNINGTTIEFKEFGISLSVKPIVDRDDNIRASVSTEVSAIDTSVSVEGVPGFLTRKTSTEISMRSGETLVISGLINQQASKDITGLKYLQDIPILGELFKSKTFRDQKSELVIFVSPTVFDADSELNKKALEYAREGIQSVIKEIDEDSLDIIY
jgi:pilus assembly protein CpaC